MIGRHRTDKDGKGTVNKRCGRMGTRETREKRRDDGGSRRRLTLLTLFFFSLRQGLFEQTLAPIRIAGLEQLDGPSTYRHAVQQQCSRCVLCLSWSVLSWAGLGGAGAGTSRRSRKRRLDRPCSMSACQCGGAGAGAQRWAAQTGEKKATGPKEEKGKKKKSGWGCGRWKRVVTRDQKQKNGKKATSE